VGWYRALTEPVRFRANLAAADQQFRVDVVFNEDTATLSQKWMRSLSEPVRLKKLVPGESWWSTFTPAPTEVVTLDKYHSPFSLPVRLRVSSQPDSFAYGTYVTPADVVVSGPDIGGHSGGTFSRGKWHRIKRELEEAWAAQQRLASAEIEGRKSQAAAKRAAEVAQLAIETAALDAVHRAGITKLTNALDAAAGASRVADVIAKSRAVVRISQEIIRQIEEEDEEAAMILLMTAL
jgi:hypothetical protein